MTASFTADEVSRVLGLGPSSTSVRFSSVSTDTRTLEPGALFVALQGERFDGVDFLGDATDRGALGAVVPVDRPDARASGIPLFEVRDTTTALGDLARHYRRERDARVVGVTGSSGKTTVKEMLAGVMGAAAVVHRTEGNLNNQIGVSLTILAAPGSAEVWVLELGSSEPGEIARLTSIAEPDDAVVTTVGPAHLEGLGDLSGVLDEKLDLVRGSSDDGVAVVGELPPELPAAARRVRSDVVTAGLGSGCDFRPDDWSYGPSEARFTHSGARYVVPAGGEHHLRDAVIAVAVALALGVEAAAAARGLRAYRPVGMRGALLELGDLTVLADCYNANPESFAAAIRHAADAFPGRRLAAVVGTMLELGELEAEAHAEVAAALLDAGFAWIAALGAFAPAFRSIAVPSGAEIFFPSDVDAAADLAASHLRGGEVLLVKASRGVRLERVIDHLHGAAGGGT